MPIKSRKGETKVICTVKAELDYPDIKNPTNGKIDFFLDWLI
jgi:hypothetical protein